MKPEHPAFMVGGITYGPSELAQLRLALIRKADNDVKTHLTESVLIFQAVAVMLQMAEYIWKDEWKEAVQNEARNLHSDKNSSSSSEGKVRPGTPGLVD